MTFRHREGLTTNPTRACMYSTFGHGRIVRKAPPLSPASSAAVTVLGMGLAIVTAAAARCSAEQCSAVISTGNHVRPGLAAVARHGAWTGQARVQLPAQLWFQHASQSAAFRTVVRSLLRAYLVLPLPPSTAVELFVRQLNSLLQKMFSEPTL